MPVVPRLEKAALLVALTVASSLSAQQAPKPTKVSVVTGTEERIELSPFVVNTTEDTGYRATNTLAGSRLKTPLKDIAGAIQVVTEEFLKDTGSTGASRLLLYTTSTEVAGADGNFTGTDGTSDDGVRRSSKETTRVRGLASADSTRGYFLTDIEFDGYNTERVTVSRGPNGMLFGLGSPGGIVDNTVKLAKFKNGNLVELAVDSFGSTRSILDVNRVLVPGKAAVRIIGLKKRDEFLQKEPFKREQRLYGNLVVKPFAQTIFRANAEFGSLTSSKPSQIAPKSNVASWVADGMLIRTPTSNPSIRWGDMSARRGPIFVYDGPATTTPTTGFHLDTRSPQSTALVGMSIWPGREQESGGGAFHQNAVMTNADRWIFDYRKHSLTGALNRQEANFDVVNLALEQTFLENRAGLELAYDAQNYTTSWNDRSTNTMSVDVSPFLPYTRFNPVTGKNDPVANPNVGRPFVNMSSGLGETVTDRSSWRMTGFYALDFKRETKQLGWLGRHVFTGMMSNQQAKVRGASTQYGDSMGLETDAIVDGNTPGANFKASSWDRSVIGIRYLGEISGPGSSNLTGIQTNAPKFREYTAVMWNRLATPNLPGEVGAWQTRNISVIDNPITGANLNKDSVDSIALVSQSYLLGDHLVLTAGWRQDKSKKWFTNDPQRTPDDVVLLDTLRLPGSPNDKVSGSAFSWGAVAHVPQRWLQKLPMGASIHYGISENFQPLAGRVDIMNRPLANPQGDTTEMGFSVQMLENKLQLRFNWYETNSKNQTDGSLGTGSIPNYERLFYNGVRTLLTGPGQANENWAAVYTLPPQGMMDAFFNPKNPNPAPGGTTSVADAGNPNVTGTSDFSSKGFEIDGTFNATKNWSMTFNAASQEAIKTNVLKQFQDYLDIRNPEWAKMAHLVVRPNGDTLGYSVYSRAQGQIAAERSKEGSILPEIRKWRINFINNYRFTEGRLRGWAIGGAARWQDKGAVGYHSTISEFGREVVDVTNPIFGPSVWTTDMWVNHTRQIMRDKVNWKIQLNLFNLLNDQRDIAVRIDDDLVVVSSRVQNGLTFRLTSTFEF